MSDKISEFMQEHPFIETYVEHLLELLIVLSVLGIFILPIVLAFWVKSAWLLLLYIFIVPLATALFGYDI